LKLGAESRHYRVFVDSRYWYTDELKSAYTIGGALQYLIRPTEVFNFFLGVNAGVINTVDDPKSDTYYGLDAGINLDVAENFGIEVGARVATTDTDKELRAETIYQGYVSAIFKFTSDY
jgi:hypothetical protein